VHEIESLIFLLAQLALARIVLPLWARLREPTVVITFSVLIPYAVSAAPAELPTGALVAVLAAVPALAGSVRLRPASDRKPAEIYLAPDPEPPRP
jgi:hypothetical protein